MLPVRNEQTLFIDGPVGSLEACFFKNPQPINAPIFGIICHPHPLYEGSMHNKVVTSIARAWQAMSISTLRFNFRGVGKSAGSYAEGVGEQEDLKAVIRWVLKQNPTAKIWLAGFSFGAYVALRCAAEGNCAGLLTVAPALRLFDFKDIPLPNCPWVIIQGEKDEFVSLDAIQSWYKGLCERSLGPNRPELVILPEAGHFFHGHLVALKEAIQR